MRYFTSDHHLGHLNILHFGEGRPFSSLGEMHKTFLTKSLETVEPDDEVFFIGDVAMGDIFETLKLVKSFPGKKYLIPGNHDRLFPKLNTKSRIEKFTPIYEDAGFTILPLWHEIQTEVDGELFTVRLSHMPYKKEPAVITGKKDKLAFARPEDDGKFLIHGHTHSRSKVSQNPKELHVGVDANDWKPVSETEIQERIRNVLNSDG